VDDPAGAFLIATSRTDLNQRRGPATGGPSALGQAFVEYGRIAKTLYLLALVDPVDTGYPRTMGRQLTVQESRHRLVHKIFHPQRGERRRVLWPHAPTRAVCGIPSSATHETAPIGRQLPARRGGGADPAAGAGN
jgi:hypothetical protein